ncbi:hypothetical protein J2T60_001846 [Natronospira proteinivora]|uniref:Extradiol ring-cleavage dioxygenase LigAB LigA subunit domain-containing protein n=1 Tax=Natronospira proteinivora TaxID=1807133 RepID=A0ABT1G9C4_9GAMM|nr:hypothetical protein [Natronospira proteinivora]MCP1727846.1 hypothetical protein [Natronospira proteinivora]
MSGLNELLRDLGSDAKLEKAYQEDPESVMERYRLTEEERQALRDQDIEKIKSLSGSTTASLSNTTVSSYDE